MPLSFILRSGLDSIADSTQAHGILSTLREALNQTGQSVTLQKICADGFLCSQVL